MGCTEMHNSYEMSLPSIPIMRNWKLILNIQCNKFKELNLFNDCNIYRAHVKDSGREINLLIKCMGDTFNNIMNEIE